MPTPHACQGDVVDGLIVGEPNLQSRGVRPLAERGAEREGMDEQVRMDRWRDERPSAFKVERREVACEGLGLFPRGILLLLGKPRNCVCFLIVFEQGGVLQRTLIISSCTCVRRER